MADGDGDDPTTDFDRATAIERARALESWEAQYRRHTEFYEEQTGRKHEGDIKLGWRMCYVALKPVTIHNDSDPRGDDDAWRHHWHENEPSEEEEEELFAAMDRVPEEEWESVEVEYRRITTEFEERTGRRLEGDLLLGWRMCYVELRPVKIRRDGHIEF